MKTTIINRFFLARIDRALDDARPLGGFTAWYVFRSPELREYYETLIEMELDLRCPETAISRAISASDLQNVQRRTDGLVPASRTRKDNMVRRKSVRKTIFTWSRGLTVSLLLLISVSLFWSSPFGAKKIATTFPAPPAIGLADLQPIPEMLPPMEERKPIEMEDNFFSKLLSPGDFLVRFSEEPLDATVSLLEMAHIIKRYELYHATP